MAIDSTKILTAVKSFARANALPLEAYEVFDSYDDAEKYAKGIKPAPSYAKTVAYVGQTLKVKENEVVTATYIIKNEDGELIRLADADVVDAAIAAIPEPEVITDAEIEAVFTLVFPEEVTE